MSAGSTLVVPNEPHNSSGRDVRDTLAEVPLRTLAIRARTGSQGFNESRRRPVARTVESYRRYRTSESIRGAIKKQEARASSRPRLVAPKAKKQAVVELSRDDRDTKLHALMAELQEQPMQPSEAKNGVLSREFANGAQLAVIVGALETFPSLLDSKKWERHYQLGDHVYTMVADGKEYIVKEQDASRHKGKKKRSSDDGLTSRQEFEVAREFMNLGTVRQGDIELRWEKPLGYVELPDGYQFNVFEVEPDLEEQYPIDQLAREIMASAEGYAEEFEQIRQRAKEIYDERRDLLRTYRASLVAKPSWYDFSEEARSQRELYKSQPKPDELTFEEFARVKAYQMGEEARELLRQAQLERGYTNGDTDRYVFRVQSGDRPVLEIVGFDFGHYSKDPKRLAHMKQGRQTMKEEGMKSRMSAYYDDEVEARAIAGAASYAMMEQAGWKMPPKE